jgi:F-type H+-transporting ATPase subunit a
MRQVLFILSLIFSASFASFAQQEGHDHVNEAPSAKVSEHPESEAGHDAHPEGEFKPGEFAVHHIADANVFQLVGDNYLPLPCILYAPDKGWKIMSSGEFEPHHHGNGKKAVDGYVLSGGNVRRITDPNFPMGSVDIQEIKVKEEEFKGKKREAHYAIYNGQEYKAEARSAFDGGIVGGGITSFYDYSITKNVFTMILVFLIMLIVFISIRKSYSKREGMAPKGLQGFFEPLITFVRDEVAKPNIGHSYEKFMPFLLSLFFFILGLNLIGQIPFFPGSANVTGNISVTIVLAVLTFLMTNLNGNKHYWGHILWMPGVPAVLKIIILTPLEVLGIFLKPFTLLLRLFANITAGHIVILSFVGLIFVFGKAGLSPSGTALGAAISVPLTLFMSTIELLVAFLQAFIFTMLTASYIGAAVEEHH